MFSMSPKISPKRSPKWIRRRRHTVSTADENSSVARGKVVLKERPTSLIVPTIEIDEEDDIDEVFGGDMHTQMSTMFTDQVSSILIVVQGDDVSADMGMWLGVSYNYK